MTWLIVHFVGDDTVECVPDIWYIEKSNECFWPPRKITMTKVHNAVKTKSKPDSDWHPYPVRVLGKYDTLEEARKRTKKAEYSSNLSSCNEHVPSKRVPKKNSKYRMSPSSSGPESSDSSEYPHFGRTGLHRSDREKKIETTKENDKSIQENRIESREGTVNMFIHTQGSQTKHKGDNANGIYVDDTEENHPHYAQEIHIEGSAIPSAVQFSGGLATAKGPLIPDSNEFRTAVLKELSLINAKLNSIMESVQLIVTVNTKSRIMSTKSDFLEKTLKKFPLSEEELNQFEFDITDENMEILALELSHVGAISVKEGTRKLMYRLIMNEVGVKYSWEGAKGKTPFKHLKLARVIIKSVRLMFPLSTEMEIINIIKLWLVRAKDRLLKTNNREDVRREENSCDMHDHPE